MRNSEEQLNRSFHKRIFHIILLFLWICLFFLDLKPTESQILRGTCKNNQDESEKFGWLLRLLNQKIFDSVSLSVEKINGIFGLMKLSDVQSYGIADFIGLQDMKSLRIV